jgi:hypothetical protein
VSNEEQEQRNGSVAHAFGQALATRWAPSMPAAIKRTGLPTLLYAMRQLANPAGVLRFTRDGKPVRLKMIAAAACCDEKDARRYIDAAITAGVVQVEGERKRGSITVFRLLVNPFPDWAAAAAHLEATKRQRPERKAPPWRKGSGPNLGGPPPVADDAEFGGSPPPVDEDFGPEVRGTAPLWTTGDRPPMSSGDRPPNNPWNTHEVSHDRAEVDPQPQVVDGWDREEPEPDDHEHDHEHDEAAPRPDPTQAAQTAAGFTRCAICHRPLVPDPKRPARTAHAHCTTAHAEAS